MRARIEAAFGTQPALLWAIWAGAPLLCVLVPGPGVLLAGIWVVALTWLGRQRPAALGLRRPVSLPGLLAGGFALGALLYLAAEFAIDPFARWLTGGKPDLSGFANLEGDWRRLLLWLALSWLAGGLLEELVFRGFFLQYGVRLLGERWLWPLAAASSLVFGVSHLYQGAAGMLGTGIIGFLLAAAFIASGRNLLLVMLAHGFVDTFYFVLAFLGIRSIA